MKSILGGGWTVGSAVAVGLIFLTFLITIIASQSVLQLPDAVTEEGERIKTLYGVTLIVCIIVYLFVTIGLIWAIFRYRRRSPSEIPEQIHGSSILEFTWTAIPVLLLVGLFIPAFILVLDLKTPPAEGDVDLEVEAIGHQWWWEFNYPESGIRIQATPPNYDDLEPPALVVPVGETIVVRVRSTDVVHSFYAPQTLYKIQAIPGNVNVMHFTVNKPGVYHGQCYQFCGLRHSNMLFVLDAREPADYQRWLQDTRRAQGLDNSPNDSAAAGVPGEAARSE